MDRYTQKMSETGFSEAEKKALTCRLQQAADAARQTVRPRKHHKRTFLIALAAALGLSATALAATGALDGVFSALLGAGHPEVVEQIATPFTQSVSDGGVTMTADAVIADERAVVIAVTARRDDGQPFDPDTNWDIASTDLVRQNVNNWSASHTATLLPDGTLRIYSVYDTDGDQAGSTIDYSIRDLGAEGKAALSETLFPGIWSFRFEDVKQPETRTVTQSLDLSGGFGSITNASFTLSPIGYHFTLLGALNVPDEREDTPDEPIQVFLVLTDGTQIDLTAGMGLRSPERIAYSGSFDRIIILEEMSHILLQGERISLPDQ